MTDLRDDPYPSRRLPEPRITERLDPVVRGEPGDGPLDAEALASFERDGFIHLPGVLTGNELELIKAEVARLEGAARSDDERVVREPDSDRVRSLFAIHEDNPLFARVAADERLVGVAQQILGGTTYIHQSRVNLKQGFVSKEFYWHSDFETWHAEDGMPRMRALSMSIALTDNTPNNGPLMVMRGSHRHFVACPGETPEDHYKASLRKQEIGVPDEERLRWLASLGGIASPVQRAGSIVIFDCNAMHGSNGNITPDPRHNLFLVYNSVDNALEAPFAGTKPRPQHIASRTSSPVVPTGGAIG